MRITIETDSGNVKFLEGENAKTWLGVVVEGLRKLSRLGQLGDLKETVKGIKWEMVPASDVDNFDDFMGASDSFTKIEGKEVVEEEKVGEELKEDKLEKKQSSAKSKGKAKDDDFLNDLN